MGHRLGHFVQRHAGDVQSDDLHNWWQDAFWDTFLQHPIGKTRRIEDEEEENRAGRGGAWHLTAMSEIHTSPFCASL